MTTKTPEELLRPRYIVIADYPGSVFDVSRILDDEILLDSMAKYPHLFRRLEWWEHRSPEEMPEYVKRITKEPKVCKVHKHNVHALNSMGFIDDADFKNRSYINYIPATLEEYTNYITTTPSLSGDNN